MPPEEGDAFTDHCGMPHDYDSGAKVGESVCTGERLWLWVAKDGILDSRIVTH